MNTERASYFTERSYTTSEAENKKDIFEYWKKILGEDTLRVAEKCYGIDLVKVLNSENYVCENNHVMSEMEKVKIELFEKPINYNYSGFKGEKLAFDNFFIPLINYGIDILKNGTSLFLTDSIIDTYANTLLERLGKISLGILMFEMYLCKKTGKLNGRNSEEEYDYYNNNFLSKKSYKQELFNIYPCLLRSVTETVENLSSYYVLLLERLNKDKNEIANKFCGGLEFKNVVEISSNISDSHKKGNGVSILKLDNGTKIVYKPRSLKIEKVYFDFLGKINAGCKYEMYEPTSIGRNGMSLAKMKEITEEHNFSFKAYGNYETEENLIKCLPIIMCSKENHYVVVAEKKYGKYILLDPLKGKEKVDYSYIKKNFLDVLVCVRPTEKNYKREKRESFLIPINKSKLFLASILTLVTQGIILIPPLIIKKIVNEITYDTLGFNFVKYALLILSVALSYLLANLAKKRVILILQNNIYKDTIFLMLNKIFDIDLSYFESHSSGDIENRFNSVSDIYEFISTALISTVIDVVTAVFCGIMMITQSIPLFAVIIVMTVIQITIVMILNQKARIKVKNYIADQSALQARMVETLTNIQQIRCMRIENMLSDSLKQDYKHLIKRLRERVQISDIMESVVGAFSIASSLILYVIGGYLVCDNRLELGTLIAFVTLAGYFTGPFQTLSLVVPQINVLKETMIRLKELMNYKSNRKNGTQHINSFESMEMQQVTFSYYGSTKPDVENVSMMLKKGEKIAFVGSSGSGKTTITKLLLNVFSHYQGQILVNGEDIKQICKEDIDRIFAIVTQVPMAMNGTIRENVDITNTLTDEEIYHYLDLVELKDDIEKFPLGLNTFVGENGQNISGGQKQRIAIARALALKPEVIIFDEATSNLDPLTERRICNNLKQLHITQIVVTHRLNAIQDADTIYVVEKGKIIESGTHVELLQLKGAYYDSVNN